MDGKMDVAEEILASLDWSYHVWFADADVLCAQLCNVHDIDNERNSPAYQALVERFLEAAKALAPKGVDASSDDAWFSESAILAIAKHALTGPVNSDGEMVDSAVAANSFRRVVATHAFMRSDRAEDKAAFRSLYRQKDVADNERPGRLLGESNRPVRGPVVEHCHVRWRDRSGWEAPQPGRRGANGSPRELKDVQVRWCGSGMVEWTRPKTGNIVRRRLSGKHLFILKDGVDAKPLFREV